MRHAGPPTAGRPSISPASSSPTVPSHAPAARFDKTSTSIGEVWVAQKTKGRRGDTEDRYRLISVIVSGTELALGVDRDGIRALLSPVPLTETMASPVHFVADVASFHEVQVLEAIPRCCSSLQVAEVAGVMVGGGGGGGGGEEQVAVAGELKAVGAGEGLHADEGLHAAEGDVGPLPDVVAPHQRLQLHERPQRSQRPASLRTQPPLSFVHQSTMVLTSNNDEYNVAFPSMESLGYHCART